MMTHFYEIRIAGHLDERWQDWFDGLSITLEEDGTTLLSGPVPDQPALHGILRRVRDLGLPLVSVNQITVTLSQQILNKKWSNTKMNANTTKKIDTKVLLSTLWIVVMINMLKADILSGFIPAMAEELASFSVSVGASIPQLMLFGAIMGQLGIAMIVLSRVLKRGVNRWLNLIVSPLYIVYIIGGGTAYPHYFFIAAIEVICLVVIFWNALKWSNPEE
jgi:hypothetical protein